MWEVNYLSPLLKINIRSIIHKMNYYSSILLVFVLSCISCTYTNTQQSRHNISNDSLEIFADDVDTTQFNYDNGGRMITNVYFNGIKYNALFDTGTPGAILSIEDFPELRDSTCERSTTIKNAWSGNPEKVLLVEKGIDIVLPSGDTLRYNNFYLSHMFFKSFPGQNMSLSIPKDYDKVINIDYGKRHLRLCDSMPQEEIKKSVLKSPISRYEHDIYMTIPLTFVFDNDTITIDILGLVDSGCDNELSFLGDVSPMLDKRVDIKLMKRLIAQDTHRAYYLANEANIINGCFVFKKSKYIGCVVSPVFGNNLLCHYNLYFDLKNKMAYGIAVEDVQKTINVVGSRMSGDFVGDKCIVTNVIDGSFFGKAGIKTGDCILSCDNKSMLEIPSDYFFGRVANLEVMRNGEVLTLEVTGNIKDEL